LNTFKRELKEIRSYTLGDVTATSKGFNNKCQLSLINLSMVSISNSNPCNDCLNFYKASEMDGLTDYCWTDTQAVALVSNFFFGVKNKFDNNKEKILIMEMEVN
jgi:hypothetical protein